MRKKLNNRGYTLVEVIVAIAVFLIFSLGIYGALSFILTEVKESRIRILQATILNEELEMIKNLSYEKVGLLNGVSAEVESETVMVPWGILQENKVVQKNGIDFVVTTTVQSIDDPFDGTVSSTPADSAPNDYKLVQVAVNCLGCKAVPLYYSTYATPKMESATTTGALLVQVVDANGVPVSGASIQLRNTIVSPSILINTTTDSSGKWLYPNARTSTLGYQLIVSKSGYSTDFTTSSSALNPYPTKLPATVISKNTTNISFAIDQASSVNFHTLDEDCSGMQGSFMMRGEKLIGSNPVIFKNIFTRTSNASGEDDLSGVEWDNYHLFATGAFDLVGTIPMSPFLLSPSSSRDVTLILAPKTTNSLLVKVMDAANGQPISGASVRLTGGSYDRTVLTELGHVIQTDWSGGLGTGSNQYSANERIDSSSGDLQLQSLQLEGFIQSNIFDLAGQVDLRNLNLTFNAPAEAGVDPVRIRIATSSIPNPSTWNFFGPDGTESSYYLPNTDIVDVRTRYLKYEIELLTEDSLFSPIVSDVAVTFTNGCQSPGQAFFSNLTAGPYMLEVSKAGYASSVSTEPITVEGSSEAIINLSR